jgi:peptidyl-prolyl cis-trans isomerase D
MLEFFRNAAKGWPAKVLLAILVLSFAVWGTNDTLTGGGSQDLAKIGSQTVSAEEFKQELNRQVQLSSQQYGRRLTQEEVRDLKIPRLVRQQVITTAAFADKARTLGLQVSAASIAREVANSPQLRQANGEFDQATFKRYLEANGLSEAGFFQIEKRQRELAILGSAAASLTVPKTLTSAIDAFQNETRTAKYFELSIDPSTLPSPTDADLKAHYERSPAAYTLPELRSVALLIAEPADLANAIAITEDEIAKAYEVSKASFETPERRNYLQLGFANKEQADKALTRLRAGEDFQKVAVSLGFKPQDITFENKSQADILDKPVAEALFKLPINALSDPIQGSLTTAIVKVTAIQAAKKPSLADVREDLRKRLQLEKAQQEIQVTYDQVEELRSQKVKFEDIATKLKLRSQIVESISANGTDEANNPVTLPDTDKLLRAIFELGPGVEASAFNLDNGFVWYEVRQVSPPVLKPFNDVKMQVVQNWKSDKTRSLLEEKAKSIVARITSVASFDAAATDNKSSIKEIKDLRRQQVRPDFDGIASIALFGVAEKTATWALDQGAQKAKIILAEKVTLPAQASAAASQTDLRKELTADLQNTMAQALRSSVDVQIDEQVWERITGAASAQ